MWVWYGYGGSRAGKKRLITIKTLLHIDPGSLSGETKLI
jgi:hypothetical protein